MIKRKIGEFIRNFYLTNSNALLVSGARQTGKTYSIRQFGGEYKSFIEINFIDNPEAVNVFKDARGAADILLRLSALTSTPLIKGETLIFLDEVQVCPDAVTAIKFLVDEGSYRYILSGSLLGVELNNLRSQPVGYMSVKDMYPLDFEEFIMAIGVNERIIDSLRSAWLNRTQVDDFIHQRMMELFRLYLVVGGMPAVVNKYLETKNLQDVLAIQKDILHLYHRDISQYDIHNKLNIDEIFNLIPPELNAKNKRFILKQLNENAKYVHYQNSFLWLKNAGVALPVYNVEEPKVPLILSRSRNLFKLFQSDIGLLAAQYAGGIQLKIITGESNINFGAIYENLVAQELVAHGLVPYYYNNKRRGEIDFVVELHGTVLPIEVKSGKDYESHRALTNILECEEYDIPEAIIFNNDNLRVVDNRIYAPIYMVMFVESDDIGVPGFYEVDISGLC